MTIITLSTILLLGLSIIIFINQPQFGKLPSGDRLERIKLSPNYQNGSFKNLTPTQTMTNGVSYWEVIKDLLTRKNTQPPHPIPSVKTNLNQLDPNENILVWFGHSSYFMQVDGKSFLVDPVFSGSASPLPYTASAFNGTDPYTVQDLPPIDYLLITHDHWDHLDYNTITKLKSKTGQVITGLGTGAHFELWGYEKESITELDWGEKTILDNNFEIHCTPARHFSGRGFKPNQSLWISMVIQAPTLNIFVGGDGGYDTHFKTIGDKFGPFDLAILENGQYDKNWENIHSMPHQVLQEAVDLKANRFLPVHSSKFALANHTWDTPLKEITRLNKNTNLALITPIIGELVFLQGTAQKFELWWEVNPGTN